MSKWRIKIFFYPEDLCGSAQWCYAANSKDATLSGNSFSNSDEAREAAEKACREYQPPISSKPMIYFYEVVEA